MITFTTGQNNYQQVDYDPTLNTLTATFTDQPIFECNSLRESLQNDVRQLGNKKIAVLFSGGMDSEVVLEVCRDIKADFYAVFVLYTYKNMPVNTHELYHVEKYCRENNTPLKTIELDLERFIEGGEYLTYAKKYYCDIAGITPILYAIDQVDECVILGGDAPHISDGRFHSPLLGQVSIERLFAMNAREGIPNFLTNSLTSMCCCLRIWKTSPFLPSSWKQMIPGGKQVFTRWAYTTTKHNMYTVGGFTELKIKPKYSSPFALLSDIPVYITQQPIYLFPPYITTVIPCNEMLTML